MGISHNFVKLSPFGLTLLPLGGYFPVVRRPPATTWTARSSLPRSRLTSPRDGHQNESRPAIWKKVGFPIEALKTPTDSKVLSKASERPEPVRPVQGEFAFDEALPRSAAIAAPASTTAVSVEDRGGKERGADAGDHQPLWRRASRLDGLAHWIALAGGLGYAPKAPGTAGSLGSVALFFAFAAASASLAGPSFASASIGPAAGAASGGRAVLGPGLVWLLLAVALAAVGVWSSARAEKGFGRSDDGRIVIDEVAGQWLALGPLLWLVPGAFEPMAAAPLIFSPFFTAAVTGFVLFRWFDIAKPGPVGWAERKFKGGVGVMADDLVAGVFAGLILALGIWLWSSGLLSSGPWPSGVGDGAAAQTTDLFGAGLS